MSESTNEPYVSRNDAIVFASRVQKNLRHIMDEFDNQEDVHVVTQLATSLLGLVVFPWEKNLVSHIKKVKLRELADKGWPEWSITLGHAETLGELVRHIRNAVAHGSIRFSSDSRLLGEVVFEVEDSKPRASKPYWRAHIGGRELYSFCLLFSEYIEETIG